MMNSNVGDHLLAEVRLIGVGRRLPFASIFRMASYFYLLNWLGLCFTERYLLRVMV